MKRKKHIAEQFELPLSDDQILDSQLDNEKNYLKNDRERYLDCMNGITLADRKGKTYQEVRNGLILYWHVYRKIVDNP